MVATIDGELWDRPEDSSAQARERSRLYNVSTLVTLTAGGLVCYLALYIVNLVWALFVLDPAVMGGYLNRSLGHGTCRSGLVHRIGRDAYSKREEERRTRLARERS